MSGAMENSENGLRVDEDKQTINKSTITPKKGILVAAKSHDVMLNRVYSRQSVKLSKHMSKSLSRDVMPHERRWSVDTESNIDASETLVSHALREVISEHIIAGPHGALLTVQPSSSLDGGISLGSTHTLEMLCLRRTTIDGTDIAVDLDDAIAETGHGRFQYQLMALCGFIYSCCSLSTTTLSFVLPAAQNDFQLDSLDKGFLNTAPLLGMVAGAYIWGNFADSKGRKFVLLHSLAVDAVAAFLSSFCQNYTLFFVCRIFNGFGIIGATSVVFAYLGEFLQPRKRDVYLSRLELFWTFGIIALPVIGFAILPRDWELGDKDSFLYNSWRMFVFACGLPSLLAAVLISRMPESPRFLLLQGHHDKTRRVLVHMFVTNTKLPPEEYHVKVLNMDDTAEAYYFPKLHGVSFWTKVQKFCLGMYKQHKDLLRGRSLYNILITCFIDFGLMSVYFTVMLWVPELLHREERYLEEHPGELATLCDVEKEESHEASGGKVENSTFVHTFIICMACLPTNIVLLLVISYISKKFLLVGTLVLTAVPAAGLYFVDTVFKVTTMLCLFEAFATLVEAVLFCAIVEIFPLTTRGTALALTVTVGRFGAVLGNIAFGFLIDTYCHYLFFGMSGILVGGHWFGKWDKNNSKVSIIITETDLETEMKKKCPTVAESDNSNMLFDNFVVLVGECYDVRSDTEM